ncbi:hypothetical protein NSA47_10885 [Irregularibacter muris]|uniref:Uncharacterized protein n=1 Tax=Irregularibacter muris TaxID=1796619 RepID=A0AAE3KZN1_9FIRM|nr:CLC_0170 family protein [Irregularibacter muris]MCR1899490.1 hypothetical protein [Irregularibacter muris]
MGKVLDTIKGMYSFYTMVLLVGCGFFTFYVDQKIMLKKDLKKEAKVTKVVGLIYIIGGILSYLIFAIFV